MSTINVKFPEGLSGVSVGNIQYAPLKEDRIIAVPVEVKDAFLAFGCLVVGENIPAEAEKPQVVDVPVDAPADTATLEDQEKAATTKGGSAKPEKNK
ncbi:MAG: hypothetical protein HGB04_03975 [Chlorobiaceae bacterium]|nr:hypothetical protein [Chlorobiaceae bacterium]